MVEYPSSKISGVARNEKIELQVWKRAMHSLGIAADQCEHIQHCDSYYEHFTRVHDLSGRDLNRLTMSFKALLVLVYRDYLNLPFCFPSR